jgi:cysteine-rich repeat protein
VDAAAGETCDDGGTAPGDGCGPTCLTEYCGNGVVDPGEVCDDGNNVGGDGCSSGCTSVEICGDGVLDPAAGEECDDGNTDMCDGCSPTCQVETPCPLGQTCCTWAAGCIPEDESNCGACGFTCNAGVYCRNGTCVEPGVIIITEFNPDPGPIPDADGEFMELYNTTSMPVNLLGWVIRDDKGSNLPKTIDQSVWVEPNGFAVLARNPDPVANGGFTADWGWWDEVTQFAYSNAEILYLEASVDTGSGTTVIMVDSVDYDNAWWASGYSTSLDPSAFDHVSNDDPANWCLTATSHPLPNAPTAYGTPGEMNDPCP